jgi:hypothetical protein
MRRQLLRRPNIIFIVARGMDAAKLVGQRPHCSRDLVSLPVGHVRNGPFPKRQILPLAFGDNSRFPNWALAITVERENDY